MARELSPKTVGSCGPCRSSSCARASNEPTAMSCDPKAQFEKTGNWGMTITRVGSPLPVVCPSREGARTYVELYCAHAGKTLKAKHGSIIRGALTGPCGERAHPRTFSAIGSLENRGWQLANDGAAKLLP